MSENPEPELPIKSQGVRKLTDEEYEKIARKLLEYLSLAGAKVVTWDDIEEAARAVLTAKPKKRRSATRLQ